MPSFSIPLSGLDADSTALNTIANNLSNMNTTAFKSQTTTFADLFYQELGTSGSGDPLRTGMGVKVSSTETNFTSGTPTSTGNASDMAINGNGFFVVEDGSGTQYLTRAGNFTTNQDGALVTTEGLKVMGYPAVNGTISAGGTPSPLLIPTTAEAPQATQKMGLVANLDATASAGTSYSTQINIYDSLGTSHQATVTFTKSAMANQWSYSVGLPAGESTGATGNTGTLTFDGTGKLTSPTGPSTITFSGLADGAANLNVSFSLVDANGNPTVTQVAGDSAVSSTSQDGFASGKYTGFSVDAAGVISATYDNGHTTALGQVALAQVNNLQGLARSGNNNFKTSFASGGANLGSAGAGGLGTIQGSALEASNVDISAEFANLIVAQRAFEASSKSVTTFDTVTQDTINMIR